jgi:hypothetical protein
VQSAVSVAKPFFARSSCTATRVPAAAADFHAAVPRETQRSRELYARRTAVERFWSRLKEEWGLLELRVRGIERVAQHVDLVVLTYLLFNVAKMRASP